MSFSCQLLAETAKLLFLSFTPSLFGPFSHSLNACSRLLPSSNQVVWGRCHRRSGMRGMRRLRERESERGCVCRNKTQISAVLSLLWKTISTSSKKKKKRIVTLHFNALNCNFYFSKNFDITFATWFFIMCLYILLIYILNFISQCSTSRQKWTFMSNSTLHIIKQKLSCLPQGGAECIQILGQFFVFSKNIWIVESVDFFHKYNIKLYKC